MEPKNEYGFILIRTAEDKAKFGPKRATDEWWDGELWREPITDGGNFAHCRTYRCRIDAGEGFELVPPDDFETLDMEFTRDGVRWNKNEFYGGPKACGWFVSRCGDGNILAFRRRKSETASNKFWMVMRLSNSSATLQQVDSLPHKKYTTKEEAESDAKKLAQAYPKAKGFIVLESVGEPFKCQKSAAEIAWESFVRRLVRVFSTDELANVKIGFMGAFNARGNK